MIYGLRHGEDRSYEELWAIAAQWCGRLGVLVDWWRVWFSIYNLGLFRERKQFQLQCVHGHIKFDNLDDGLGQKFIRWSQLR